MNKNLVHACCQFNRREDLHLHIKEDNGDDTIYMHGNPKLKKVITIKLCISIKFGLHQYLSYHKFELHHYLCYDKIYKSK